ncbi:MAG: bifunctional [glutamate--ammonia ligase]-adenylyl-L-tyrosine phosphorylase/[glutamate--ammonia-ligase] adenylyltransferase [Halioglobus sp.]
MSLITEQLPESLIEVANSAWDSLIERASDASISRLTTMLQDRPLSQQLARLLATSPFVADLLRRKPEILIDLVDSGELHTRLPETVWRDQLMAQMSEEDAELGPVLRRFRQRHMLRIVWRDFCRLADTLETVRDTSLLADACIEIAQVHSQIALERRHGKPIGAESGEPQTLIVLAMGKLGAQELNVSSDIDLIFAYPESGQTDGSERPLSNEEFFTRLGRAIIAALDPVTAEGFVFRVDMRLRPYGDSGALVHNFNALEEYYQDQGRDWERYALIKARPVTGDKEPADYLMSALRPFVYRRYIDFGVIASLRGMKAGINAEVRRRGLNEDVKLGHGGIREVEFIAQCFQLIRGGRDAELQQRELLPVLAVCRELGCLPEAAVAELIAAYLFLRNSEHAIQGYADKQTQALPIDALARTAMALVMGCADWGAFLLQLEQHRARVSSHFEQIIAAPEEDSPGNLLRWDESLSTEDLLELGFNRAQASLQVVNELHNSPRVLTLQTEGRERLDQFMPQLIRACADVEHPDLALQRVLPLVEAVLRRSAYLALLLENPSALTELVSLCHASPWISEQLARSPVLLDELLDGASLYSAPDKALLDAELRPQVARLLPHDLEAQMDTLRYFKAAHVLRVAASELSGRLPLMQVSDKLTYIAEVILDQVLRVAWADLTAKYGEPARANSDTGFAVYGFGKLGGLELGYGSDLDLVFVYNAAEQGVTSGERAIDNVVFYTRLGQRIIHILDTRMALGQLYEVDMRLRPSGESGMLVITTKGFAKYQREEAWTWEHQALVRARFVAGDRTVADQVDAVRLEVLATSRDAAELAGEVQSMRRRMREHLLPADADEKREFHLKQGTGGIVDLEFMVQYAVLAWSSRYPELAQWSDNVRILEALGEVGLFSTEESDTLTQAYLAFRSASHQLALQQLPGTVPVEQFSDFREAVSGKWQQMFAGFEATSSTDENET